MKYLITIVCTLSLLSACHEREPQLSAQEIVDKAIQSVGGDVIANASIHFKFRDYYYHAKRENGARTFMRCTDYECEKQQDILRPDGDFLRFRESEQTFLPDSLKRKFSNSVNSVHYFSLLPFGLNDAAVTKTYIDKATVKDKRYHRIKVTFAEDGGGEDFEDQYLYWIDTEDYSVDYLAYNYQVNEGGTRFREAFNERIVKGVRFVDYKNYKPATQFPPLTDLDSLFENNALQLLSTIALENPEVEMCPEC